MVGRPPGSRAHDYEEKRRDLVHAVRRACLETPTEQRSLRDIAAACGVSPPTLSHYFGDRAGMVRAVLEQSLRDAARHFAEAERADGPLADRVAQELRTFHDAFTRFGLDRLNTWGMTEGLADERAGTAYLEFLLEPTLQGAEAWITRYRDAGEIPETVNPRFAALALYSPCIVLFLHQNHLGGRDFRPADVEAFIEEHAPRFLSYVGADPGS